MMEAIIAISTTINLLISSGVLWKLIEFARNYGKLEQKVEGHDDEFNQLRQDLRELRR